MPEWVTTAYEEYTRRMRKDLRVDLEEIPVGRVKTDEEKRLLERIGDDYLVALDERGKSLTTLKLAKWLGERQQDGRQHEADREDDVGDKQEREVAGHRARL
jgi:23S rRNA (pseudouridine1915-N3)-methyltransferase